MWVAAGLVLLMIVGAVVLYLAVQDRCERRCAAAVEEADRAAERGDVRAALSIIDETDHACRCGRFTSGDEPPEYAAARVYLERLRRSGREAEAREILAAARGPTLRELARTFDPP